MLMLIVIILISLDVSPYRTSAAIISNTEEPSIIRTGEMASLSSDRENNLIYVEHTIGQCRESLEICCADEMVFHDFIPEACLPFIPQDCPPGPNGEDQIRLEDLNCYPIFDNGEPPGPEGPGPTPSPQGWPEPKPMSGLFMDAAKWGAGTFVGAASFAIIAGSSPIWVPAAGAGLAVALTMGAWDCAFEGYDCVQPLAGYARPDFEGFVD